MSTDRPAYLEAAEDGRLKEKIRKGWQRLEDCTLCPRKCHADRMSGQTGDCRTGRRAWVSSCGPHFGEEAPLVGTNGSGTIFITFCSLLCNFCQNHDISHEGSGVEVTDGQLARMMLLLEKKGCHNINFVTPTHVVPQILSAVGIASELGLNVPLVYNSSGYDAVETIELLDGIVDIYMPDFKFWDSKVSKMTCNAPDYPEVARTAILEMHRQVGDLAVDGTGLARRGLLIRHLVMPREMASTGKVMDFIATSVSPDSYVNIMPQYRPCGEAREVPGLDRTVTSAEWAAAIDAARKVGIDHPPNAA